MAFDCSYLKQLYFLYFVTKSGFKHPACCQQAWQGWHGWHESRYHLYDAKRPPPQKPSSRHYLSRKTCTRKKASTTAPFDRVLSRSHDPCLETRGLLSFSSCNQSSSSALSSHHAQVCSSDPRTHPCAVGVRTPEVTACGR